MKNCTNCGYSKADDNFDGEFDCTYSDSNPVPFAHVKHSVEMRDHGQDGIMIVSFDDCGWPERGSTECQTWKPITGEEQ